MIGNIQAQEMVAQFFSALREGKTVFPFLVLAWRSHVGKTSCAEKHIHELVGLFGNSDFIALYDLSEQLGKEHTIKIESGRDDEYLTVNEKTYANRWMRELQQWLSRAPLWDWKIVYIENIERMTTAAANALLKSLEEPLPWRLIVASVTDASRLLDTIRSRALIIPFSLVDTGTMRDALAERFPGLSRERSEFLVGFSFGAWWMVEQLMQKEDLDEWVAQFSAVVGRLKIPTLIVEQMSRLQRFATQGQLDQLIDALLYAWHWTPEKLVRVKKLLETNVGQDNVLFQWCMEESN